MIEQIMFLAIGFLAASLLALLLMPLVHNRAVRLTVKRLDAAAPVSMLELQAEKDQLRAEFAMSVRRLELLVEHLKAENASQFAELGKRADAINLFKLELGEKESQIRALQTRLSELEQQLTNTQEQLAAKTASHAELEQVLSQKQDEIVRLSCDLTERELTADSQRVEIIALHAQVEALKNQINDMRVEQNAMEMVEADLRARLATAAQESNADRAQERAENAELREQISQIAAEIARLTLALEGPRSPIEKLLSAAETDSVVANGGNSGSTAEASDRVGPAVASRPTLGERIRALQSKAQRFSATTG
jgi:chromosome segregation ATPase